MKFKLENYAGGYVMHCDTEAKANIFCKFLHEQGRRWSTGDSYAKYNSWGDYRKDTCYYFNEGVYSNVEFAKREGCTVLEFDDFDFKNAREKEKMKATLKIDGEEVEIEISEEELEKLKVKKRTGYEKANFEEYFCAIDMGGDVYKALDCSPYDEKLYERANYYTDEKLAENCGRADSLLKQLRRFAVEHRKKELDWSDESTQAKYYLFLNDNGIVDVEYMYNGRILGVVYFDSIKTAHEAIDKFRDELEWYYTEFKDSLGEQNEEDNN